MWLKMIVIDNNEERPYFAKNVKDFANILKMNHDRIVSLDIEEGMSVEDGVEILNWLKHTQVSVLNNIIVDQIVIMMFRELGQEKICGILREMYEL